MPEQVRLRHQGMAGKGQTKQDLVSHGEESGFLDLKDGKNMKDFMLVCHLIYMEAESPVSKLFQRFMLESMVAVGMERSGQI